MQHVLQVAPALRDVAQHAPRQPRVRVRVNEQLQVELVSKQLYISSNGVYIDSNLMPGK